MAERSAATLDEKAVLAAHELDLGLASTAVPEFATGMPEFRVDRAVSPVIARAAGSVVDQLVAPRDGSGDRNFPEINAFNSVL